MIPVSRPVRHCPSRHATQTQHTVAPLMKHISWLSTAAATHARRFADEDYNFSLHAAACCCICSAQAVLRLTPRLLRGCLNILKQSPVMRSDPARLLHLRFFLPLLPDGLLEAAAEPDAAACCFACSSRTFFAFSDLPGCRGQSSATFSSSAFPAHRTTHLHRVQAKQRQMMAISAVSTRYRT